ncbi:hypothetical protein K6119_10910 [Paracrocinitomix mangrovi]|uniref:hypothetical protein n=1 Tax=Paracrocinitomix mangrovi TaxID=2862509 RepID=UPI001C8E966B|nr:hypothetical protein [Paracrocinitomix mangrovi]UKN00243.1 hypothetical protein K6119_10910 [Paracrocinitomix mangrovi]
MRFNYSKIPYLLVLLVGFSFSGFSQKLFTLDTHNVDNNRLKMEIEPGLFFNSGRSINGLYTVTPDRNFAVGLYLMATDIPEKIHKNMFNNALSGTNVRVTQEYALLLRYRIRAFKKYESNPYVGLISGWEELRLTQDSLGTMYMSTFLMTPHVGFELYLYKRMLYLNTQFRSVFYLGAKKSDAARPEELKSYLLLPSISLGLRL